MDNIVVYEWWGNSNEPPLHLKTKKQLSEIGLKPLDPVGVIYTRKYDLYLYDINNPESAIPKKKLTDSQLKALSNGREKQRYKREYKEWYRCVGRLIKDRNEAIEWASSVLRKNEHLILDTETTGLYDAEIVQIGIINLEGKTILDSLIKPTIIIPEEAIAIHGITNEAVKNAPTFPEVYPSITEALKNKKIAIYNRQFEISIFKYCCHLHNLTTLKLNEKTDCIMEAF